MPLYSKKEFAEVCGLKSLANLSMAIKRDNVIVSGNFIDDSIEPNLTYKAIQQEKNGVLEVKNELKAEEKTKKSKSKEQKLPKKHKNSIEIPFEDPDKDKLSHAGSIRTLEKIEKQQKIDKNEQEKKLNELRIAKITGELIPVDQVNLLFSIHFKSVTVSFHQAADNLSTEMCKMLGGGREDLVKIKARLIDIVNQAVISSKESTSNELSNIIDDIVSKNGK